VLLCSLSSEFALSFWNAYFPLLLAGKGFSPEVIALYFSLRGVATASIRPLLGVFTRRVSRTFALIASLATMALALAMMPALGRPTEFAAVVLLFGTAAGFIFPLTLALVSVGFSVEAMGTGVGIRQFVTRIGQLLGPVLLGLVTQAAGLTTAFVTSAVVVGGTAAVYARFRARGG
jgi:predicted MFS family arabinose efflux permease